VIRTANLALKPSALPTAYLIARGLNLATLKCCSTLISLLAVRV